MVITEVELITDPEERKKLRDRLSAEYKRLTGLPLTTIEGTVNKRQKLSQYKAVAKKHLLDISSEYFQIGKEILIGESRKAALVKCRHMVFYFLHQVKMPKEQIAQLVGKDHSTIIHAISTVKGYVTVDKEYKEEYEKYKNYCIKELEKNFKKQNSLSKEQKDAILYSIKKGGITYKELAEIYGVSTGTISGIKNNKNKVKGRYKKTNNAKR